MSAVGWVKSVRTSVENRSPVGNVFDASDIGALSEPLQIFVRLGALILIATGFALAAHWLVSSSL